MAEVTDAEWLLGSPDWWPSTAGSKPQRRHGLIGPEIDEGVEPSKVPDIFSWETAPSNEWKVSDYSKGGVGWLRQRFKPPARAVLIPCSWSLFFFVISVIPLVFPGNTPDDQMAALGLFVIGWTMTIFPAWNAMNLLPSEPGRLIGIDTWISLLLSAVVFPLHIFIDPRIGWISYTASLYGWWRLMLRFQSGFSAPSNRWLLPFEPTNWKGIVLSQKWKKDSKRWRNGPLAHHEEETNLRLYGISRGKNRFIALHYIHDSGWLNDPFSRSLQNNQEIQRHLETPPLAECALLWPHHFLRREDESE